MVWMIIFFPALAVVGGISTIFIALNTEDGLVDDNYYKDGLQINQVIKHDRMASELGLRALVSLNTQSGEIRLNLSSTSQVLTAPAKIDFKLIHRTRSGLDQSTALNQVGDGMEYRGYLKPPVIEGRWVIEINSQNLWRLRKSFANGDSENLLIQIDA